MVAVLAFLGAAPAAPERARADPGGPAAGTPPLRIVAPVDSAIVGDGNLALIEAVAAETVELVEFQLGGEAPWTPARRRMDDPTRWQHLWADPAPGYYRIGARALRSDAIVSAELGIVIQVRDVWNGSVIIDNPYAGAGTFYRGQVHTHSTNSFDGWRSLPPGHLALEYKQRGYQFVIISDHDVVSYPREIEDSGFVVIPGYESTSDTGHITAAFVQQVVPSNRPSQERLERIREADGLAILNHPSWQIGWSARDLASLTGYIGLEVYNGKTHDAPQRTERSLQLWHEALNARGWQQRIWSVAVDDAHMPGEIDRGWVAAKLPRLDAASVRRSLERGAFYASAGPSFEILGVLQGAIAASSPDAAVLRFIDHTNSLLAEGPASGARYRPRGTERWIRVEAVASDGRAAWSQPFWLLPNAPQADVDVEAGALVGDAMPGARVHVSSNGQYLGNAVANSTGRYSFDVPDLTAGSHDFWVVATAPWPDRLDSPPTFLSYRPRP